MRSLDAVIGAVSTLVTVERALEYGLGCCGKGGWLWTTGADAGITLVVSMAWLLAESPSKLRCTQDPNAVQLLCMDKFVSSSIHNTHMQNFPVKQVNAVQK